MSCVVEELYLAEALKRFRFLGPSEDVSMLQKIVEILATVPSGRGILDKIGEMNKKIPVYFDRNLKNAGGAYNFVTKRIRILPIDINIPEMTEQQRFKALCLMTQVLAHELQHVINLSSVRKMRESARDLDELTMALRLDEASAYLSSKRVEMELGEKYPEINEIYMYQCPNDPEVHRCASPNDPNYIANKGWICRVKHHVGTPEEVVRKACAGEIKCVEHSVDLAKQQDWSGVLGKRPREDYEAGKSELIQGMCENPKTHFVHEAKKTPRVTVFKKLKKILSGITGR